MHRRADCTCRRPPRAERDDPRFRRLPWGDGRVRRRLLDAPTEEYARLTEGFLQARNWGLHRIGQARGAHGPNGVAIVYGWRFPGREPAPWAGRLESGARAARPARRRGRRTTS